VRGLSLGTVRKHCLDCSGSFKSVLWCPCDGIHSTRCELWPYRLGSNPATVAERFGPALVTPELMPGAYVCEDDLPNGMAAAATYLSRAALQAVADQEAQQ
jgi:hypothetical protein